MGARLIAPERNRCSDRLNLMFEPEFFRKAEQGATTQEAYFKWQLTQPNVIAVVHEAESGIDGFAIASLITAPPCTCRVVPPR